MLSEWLLENSTAYRIYQRSSERLHSALKNSRLVQRLGGAQTQTENMIDNQSPSKDRNATPSVTVSSDQSGDASPFSVQQSVMYRGLVSLRDLVAGSWLYRWLTKEPDPDVIVIDLRETRSVGPILSRLERLFNLLRPAVVRSSVSRGWYRVHRQLSHRPVRAASFTLIGVALMTLLIMVTAGTIVPSVTFGLIALLILSARGTQSTMDWKTFQQTRWYRYLSRIQDWFRPP